MIFFLLVPPNFNTEKKTAKQPITAFLSNRISGTAAVIGLLVIFILVLTLGGTSIKKPPCKYPSVKSFDYQMLSLTDSKPHQQMALRVQQMAVHVHITKRKPKSLQKKYSCIKGSVILGIYVIDIQRRYSIISKSFYM